MDPLFVVASGRQGGLPGAASHPLPERRCTVCNGCGLENRPGTGSINVEPCGLCAFSLQGNREMESEIHPHVQPLSKAWDGKGKSGWAWEKARSKTTAKIQTRKEKKHAHTNTNPRRDAFSCAFFLPPKAKGVKQGNGCFGGGAFRFIRSFMRWIAVFSCVGSREGRGMKES